MFAKFLNLFSKNKINPMIGAAGISAFPMASRVVNKMGLKENPQNFLLMQAAGANVSGQIASVVAGGLIMRLVAGNTQLLQSGGFADTLPIMAKGMGGIFFVILAIYASVVLLRKMFP